MPEMSQNEEVVEALHQLADKYPEAEIIGRFPDEPEQPTFGHDVRKSEEDLDAVKPVAELSSIQLAQEIDAFARDFDFCDYNDMVDDREANVRQLAESIESGNTGDISEVLQGILADEDGTAEDRRKAKELINNLPQNPEEKKEPAPQREMRETEVKRVRKRVSMKALLPLKKADVAEREKKPPETSAPCRRPCMSVDD